MEINELRQNTIEFLKKWIKTLNNLIENKAITVQDNLSFGNYIIIHCSESHYVIEVLGRQSISNNPKFSCTTRSFNNLNSLMNGGKELSDYNDVNPMFKCSGISFLNMNFLSDSLEKFDTIFKEAFNGNAITKTGAKYPIIYDEDTDRVVVSNCLFGSTNDLELSLRRHSVTLIVKRDITNQEYKNFLKETFNTQSIKENKSVVGLFIASPKNDQFRLELQSFAYQDVHETTIDKFIKLHAEIFAKALGYKRALSNVKLEIQKDNEEWGVDSLIPDYLLEREDGYYDILDLKLGLWGENFTQGKWNRLKFSSYANTLIGQLRGYHRYFSTKENATWALTNKGIKVSKPILIGIAGNHNNFIRPDVDIALESYAKDTILMSYNELVELIRKI